MSQKIAPLSGFPEWLPGDRLVEQQVLDVVRETFELHGFVNIETRAVEPVERLLGKGGDADKEIYGISRLAQAEDERKEAALGLHLDLTVPFARYVLENAGKLTFPFRRYQIQKVWRGERPQEGRYREFTQADIDIIGAGELPFHYEAEVPLVIADVFAAADRAVSIQVNNRKIPEGFYLGIGFAPEEVAGVLPRRRQARQDRRRRRRGRPRRDRREPRAGGEVPRPGEHQFQGPLLRRPGPASSA